MEHCEFIKWLETCSLYESVFIFQVKRVVSGREVKIEYRVREFTEHSGYEVRVRYRKAGKEVNQRKTFFQSHVIPSQL